MLQGKTTCRDGQMRRFDLQGITSRQVNWSDTLWHFLYQDDKIIYHHLEVWLSMVISHCAEFKDLKSRQYLTNLFRLYCLIVTWLQIGYGVSLKNEISVAFIEVIHCSLNNSIRYLAAAKRFSFHHRKKNTGEETRICHFAWLY